MHYSKDATRTAIELAGLAPRSQEMFEHWLSLWNGNELPGIEKFRPRDLKHLAQNTLLFDVVPDKHVSIRYAGENFSQPGERGLIGTEWLNDSSPKSREERLRRFSASARGAIVRGIPEATLKSEHSYFFEAVHFPFRAGEDGITPILVYVDWDPPNNENLPLKQSESANLPIVTEIIPIALNGASSPTGPVGARPVESERAKIVSHAAMRFLLNLAADFMLDSLTSSLDPLDYYIATAVGSANISHIDSDPALSRQYAGLIEPDYTRRGISRAAISRATGLPLETVRRRINRMITLEILVERKDGVIVPANNPLKLGTRLDRMHVHAQLVERLFRELKARGVRFD
jgi:hypothetical protein